MLKGKAVSVVMPAYNAEKTLIQTYQEIMDEEIVDIVIMVDDASSDKTVEIARSLPNLHVIEHARNIRIWRKSENML